MAVLEISKRQFDELRLPESCKSLWIEADEVAWFQDHSARVVGVVVYQPEGDQWGYSLCVKDDGHYQRVGVGSGFTSLNRAERDLTNAMRSYVGDSDKPA